MKHIYLYKLFFLFFIILPHTADSQWAQTSGPEGGDVSSFALSGKNIFVGTLGGGVFLSTNNGVSWSTVNKGLANRTVYSLAVSESTIFAGTKDKSRGLFFSSNNGSTWTSSPDMDYKVVNTIVVLGTNIFAGTGDDSQIDPMGIYKSTNNGKNWKYTSTGLPDTWITDLTVVDSNIFAGTHYGGIFLSTNNGTNWNAISIGLTNPAVTAIMASDGFLFAGTNSGIYRSSNNGHTWYAKNTGLETSNRNVRAIASSDKNLFIGTQDGIYLSTNNGENWTAAHSDLLKNGTDIDIRAFAVTANENGGNNIFAGVLRHGIFLSTNNGTNWESSNDGFASLRINVLAHSDTNLFAGTDRGLFHTSNNGTNWKTDSIIIPNQIVRDIKVSGNDLILGSNKGVFLSTDQGFNWNKSGLINTEITSVALSETIMFGGNWNGIYRSQNNGLTWTNANNGFSELYVNDLAIYGTNLFAGQESKGIFLSTDFGTHWYNVNAGLSQWGVKVLAISDSAIFAGTTGGAFRSTNNGTTWTKTGLTDFYTLRAFAVNGANIFASVINHWDSEGLFLSTNNGVSWSSINTGLENYTVLSLDVFGNYLYAGTNGNGVWRRPLSEIISSVDNDPTKLPSRFNLEQNYPNPFNPTTTISFTLPFKSFVILKIFDVLGKEISTLCSEELDNGAYSKKWNASNLPSGLYFYRLTATTISSKQAGSFSETKKLLLLK